MYLAFLTPFLPCIPTCAGGKVLRNVPTRWLSQLAPVMRVWEEMQGIVLCFFRMPLPDMAGEHCFDQLTNVMVLSAVAALLPLLRCLNALVKVCQQADVFVHDLAQVRLHGMGVGRHSASAGIVKGNGGCQGRVMNGVQVWVEGRAGALTLLLRVCKHVSDGITLTFDQAHPKLYARRPPTPSSLSLLLPVAVCLSRWVHACVHACLHA